jgi:hypothetical protein
MKLSGSQRAITIVYGKPSLGGRREAAEFTSEMWQNKI